MPDFRVVYFDEIEDPYQVTLLFQLSLFFPATPKLLEEMRANDHRYMREFGIFALTMDGVVAAGHLLMRIPTQTTKGRSDFGGVNAVATHPEFAKRGIMTRIMNTAHQYFREHDLQHSVLTTSARLGAMTMYRRLGYVELDRSQVAVKYPNQGRTAAPPDVLVRSFSEDDVPSIVRVYRAAVNGSYGFIFRPDNFLKARRFFAGEFKTKENLRIAQKSDMVTGYACWSSNSRLSEAEEIIALDAASFHALLADAEQRKPEEAALVWCDGLTSVEYAWLRDAGYQLPIESYGRAVIKSLKERTDSRRLKALYGVGTGRFRLGLLDST